MSNPETGRFSEYRHSIEDLPLQGRFGREELVKDSFFIAGDHRFETYYAPFDHINDSAVVMLVGVSPGWTQMEASFVDARRAIADGTSDTEVLRRAKTVAAFSGSLRTNLLSMLDGIGLPSALGITASSELFTPRGAGLVQTTSMLRYPVFNHAKNYSGSPPVSGSELLTEQLDPFVRELAAVSGALIVPLGKAVATVIGRLIEGGHVEAERCLLGFPHPSGAFAGRTKQYAANRDGLSRGIAEWFGS